MESEPSSLGEILLLQSLDRPLLFGQLCLNVLLEQTKTPLAMILNGQSRIEASFSSVEIGCPGLQSFDQLSGMQLQPIGIGVVRGGDARTELMLLPGAAGGRCATCRVGAAVRFRLGCLG